MKAYLVHNPSPLIPFQKPASRLRLHGCTVESRLRKQLTEVGCDVVDVDTFDRAAVLPGSLVVGDDVLLSNTLLRQFLRQLPDRRRSYQCEIDSSRFTLLAEASAPPAFQKLPLHYVGDDRNADAAPLRMTPTPIYEVKQGLPARMDKITDIRIYFFDFFGIHLKYWFDLQAASSLYCREYVSTLVGPLSATLPRTLLDRVMGWEWLMERCNSIGKNTRIHPTAILEGCIVGEGVEIGPFAYLRSSVIGDRAVLRERTSVKMSFVGEGAFLMGTDVVNSYIGPETSIFGPMLYNVVYGERGFLSGGSGFSDFILGSGSITTNIDGMDIPSNLKFLGSAVGDDCYIGANLIFAPGRTIPDGTRLLDHGLLKSMPRNGGGTYVVSGAKLLQIPDGFVGKARS
ncbi:MAG TPA: hypothetical protein VM580_11490 [Labilithrix sp.]|jgi:acetyltransferase-like isoleucine patch superfamily enzyme|nr:hypothetical protein [Labilithrix sp.]